MIDLEILAELYVMRESLTAQKADAIAAAMAPVQPLLDEIQSAYAEREALTNSQIADLEARVKGDALRVGASIRGSKLMVVWSKGRVTWDSTKLDGMMVLIPQLEAARKVGEPSVAIRKVG